MTVPGSGRVAERRVFYIPGYDPFPPRRYRELYRREAAEQARIAGHAITLGPGLDPLRGWRVRARIEGADVCAEVTVLVWSDIVQGSMGGGTLATYGQLVRTAFIYLHDGTLWRLMRLRRGPLLAALYPVMMLLGQLALALVLASVVGAGVARLTGPGWTSAAGLAVVPLVLRLFRKWDRRLMVRYLMADYAFSARDAGAIPDALAPRLARFADALAEALTARCDEVLVVGHSSGAQLAISVLAGLIRDGRVPAHAPDSLVPTASTHAGQAQAEPAATEPAVTGQAVTGQAVTGKAVTAQAVTERAVTALAVPGQAVTGKAVTGQAVTGQAGQAQSDPALTEQADRIQSPGGHAQRTHPDSREARPALSLLTLGQVVPMVSFLPNAGALRADLALLAATDLLTWVDVSAPGDGCAFALCDPVAVTGVAPQGKRWPLVLSAAFSQTLSPSRLRKLKRRYFRLHFQYLCAFDHPEGYDYFAITAGPQTLSARFSGRKPSPGRIETPLSRYRDLGP